MADGEQPTPIHALLLTYLIVGVVGFIVGIGLLIVMALAG